MLAYITKRRQDFLDYLEPYWWEVKCTVYMIVDLFAIEKSNVMI